MTQLIESTVCLDKALFVLSIDTELAWGSFDRNGLQKYRAYYPRVRRIITSLLDLFDRYSIKATWAVVGHLFLESCSRSGDNSHSHVLQPSYSWYPEGWLSHDPYSNVNDAPFFYAPDIVNSILSSRQRHEIGSHTFSHAIIGDPECSREVAYSQFAECKRLARALGTEMSSVVFPRNSPGHLDVLYELGFSSFRGSEENWYRCLPTRAKSRMFCHLADRLLSVTPPCYSQIRTFRANGFSHYLFDLPASMFYTPFRGMWRLVGISRRVLQARKGIRKAIRDGALFHLWFHPLNLATSPLLMGGLEEILSIVSDQVKAGNIRAMTMSETAEYLQDRIGAHK